MTDFEVMPGAEPLSIPGGPHGALVLHGFSGCPQSMRGLAEAFGQAGFATQLPRLPGHGTSADDLATTSFTDWLSEAERAYSDLASRCDRVVVAGLSMGATLATFLAARHPEIAGIVVINAAVAAPPAEMRDGLQQMIDGGIARIPGPGNDVAEPGQVELAYAEVPTACLLALLDALVDLQDLLPTITCPSLVITSEQDHVVPPASSDHLAATVGGPVERLTLTKSFHVATIDYERADLEAAAVAFATKVNA